MSTYKTTITIITEDASDFACLVVMINTEILLEDGAMPPTYPARVILGLQYVFVFLRCKTILEAKVTLPAQSGNSFTLGSLATTVKYLGPVE